MNAPVFIEFLRRLMHGSTRKILLIVDGHPVHRSKAVNHFVAKQGGHSYDCSCCPPLFAAP